MSSSGRYQSQLFNFVTRQSLRLRDRSSQAWRQVKLAAVWGMQILLYPLYVTFQTTRLVGKQLRQTIRQTLPQLQAATRSLQQVIDSSEPMSADTPILRSLQAIQDLLPSLPDAIAKQLSPSSHPPILPSSHPPIPPSPHPL
ncbi:MAG: hypothetical protein HC866_26255, partial [Leptolyngbyaceae cyanobacterium RU_5_1]|nr:hypothetical protein [Leptolyngbyaceae cyanobacterium RU_5_1]